MSQHPSRARLHSLARKIKPKQYGTPKYARKYDRFWDALDKRKGEHVAEDMSHLWMRYYRTKNKSRRQNIRDRIRSGNV